MKQVLLRMFCAAFLGCSSHSWAKSPVTMDASVYDSRTPQGTLRAFASALNAFDLQSASAHISGAEPFALTATKSAQIQSAMRKTRIRYGITHLRIATNDDIATIAFFFGVERLPNKTSYQSWAVLKRNEHDRWQIEPRKTLDLADHIYPFSAFVSLFSGQPFAGEARGEMGMRGKKLMEMGHAVRSFVYDHGEKFALQNATLREALLPYSPTLDVLSRPWRNREIKISFNEKLRGVPLKKIRFPRRTVMLYEGENGRLDFSDSPFVAVTLVSGNVTLVTPQRAQQILLWSP